MMLVRQMKLHALVGDSAVTDPRVHRIIDFYEKLFHGLEVTTIPSYREKSIFYHKGDVFYMELDLDNGIMWCRDEGLWSFLQKDMGIGYYDTQVILRLIFRKYIKQQVSMPLPTLWGARLTIEQLLRAGGGTPVSTFIGVQNDIEDNLRTRPWNISAIKRIIANFMRWMRW